MKLIRHHEEVVALIERAWEKAYLVDRQTPPQWLPLVIPGQALLCAEIHSCTRRVRLCEGYTLSTEQRVTFQGLDDTDCSSSVFPCRMR